MLVLPGVWKWFVSGCHPLCERHGLCNMQIIHTVRRRDARVIYICNCPSVSPTRVATDILDTSAQCLGRRWENKIQFCQIIKWFPGRFAQYCKNLYKSFILCIFFLFWFCKSIVHLWTPGSPVSKEADTGQEMFCCFIHSLLDESGNVLGSCDRYFSCVMGLKTQWGYHSVVCTS